MPEGAVVLHPARPIAKKGSITGKLNCRSDLRADWKSANIDADTPLERHLYEWRIFV